MNFLHLMALAAQDTASKQQGQPNPWGMVLPLSLIAIFFYFLILRPQKKDRQNQEDMRTNVKKGDRVKTIGGAYGIVTSIDSKNKIVTIQFDKNCKIDFDRDAIQSVVRSKDEAKVDTEEAKA